MAMNPLVSDMDYNPHCNAYNQQVSVEKMIICQIFRFLSLLLMISNIIRHTSMDSQIAILAPWIPLRAHHIFIPLLLKNTEA